MRKYTFTSILLLAIVFNGTAQPRVIEWSRKFSAYQSVWKKTNLHLTLNQNKFSPGDTVWFKAYFLTEDLKGVNGKQLIDLNLVDARGDVKIHLLFTVINGLGANQFTIPENLSAGNYLVTAHSSWMKNFDPRLIFKKQIEVVRENELIADDKPQVSAFAEGGHLIRDIPNKLVIRTNRPKDSIELLNTSGNHIGKTITDVSGFSSMIVTPEKGESYFLRIVGDSIEAPAPEVEEDGCGIRLTPGGKNEPARIILSSPSMSARRNEELTIIINSMGRIIHTASFIQGLKESVSLEIPHGNFEGIAHLSVLDKAGNLLASRDYYQSYDGALKARVSTEKSSFQRREKVKLEVSLTDKKGQPAEGEFSVSVINSRLFESKQNNLFPDDLNLFPRKAERINLDNPDINSLMTLDNYLISTSAEVPWKEILLPDQPNPSYNFTSAVRKSGRAYYANTLTPVPDGTRIMFYLQKDMMRYQTSISENGKVVLTMPDVFGPDEFFYIAETRKGKEIPNLKIEWTDETFPLPHAISSSEIDLPDPYGTFVSKTRLIDQSYGFYTSTENTRVGNNQSAGRDFEYEIGGADIDVNLEDYIVYPTVQELIKEVIPSLFHRTKGGKSVVRVNLSESMMMMSTGDPVYIIDGIATKNTDFFLSLKPMDILQIKIIKDPKKLAPFGLMGKNGIVIAETKSGNLREPLHDSGKLIEGINRAVKFTNPDYSVVNDTRQPDFRSTIYWNASIKTDKNGKALAEFFCSDDPGKMNIRIEGLTADGEPFSADYQIEVTKAEKN